MVNGVKVIHMHVVGGGGTDIRINVDSLYSRVIVAGGGGGDQGKNDYHEGSGFGGGISGEASVVDSCNRPGGVGTQTSAGTNFIYEDSGCYVNGGFGFGGAANINITPNYPISGGGGGWYGGGTGGACAGGSGGSGYVYTSSTASNYPSGCKLNSSYYLTNAETKTGNTSFPSPTSNSNETGHSGNGYARITPIN